MDVQSAVELTHEALWIGILIGTPVLVTGMLVGLLIGLLQAVTQIQEQSLAFIPKLAVMMLIFLLTLPWTLTHMIEYGQQLIQRIPSSL